MVLTERGQLSLNVSTTCLYCSSVIRLNNDIVQVTRRAYNAHTNTGAVHTHQTQYMSPHHSIVMWLRCSAYNSTVVSSNPTGCTCYWAATLTNLASWLHDFNKRTYLLTSGKSFTPTNTCLHRVQWPSGGTWQWCQKTQIQIMLTVVVYIASAIAIWSPGHDLLHPSCNA